MKPIILFLSVIGLISIKAQESFTLESAINFALTNNVQIKNADLDNQIMVKKIWEIKAQGLPQISASGQFQNFIDIPTQVLPANAFNPNAPEGELIGLQFGTDFNVNAGIQVNQLLFNGNYLIGLQAVKALKVLNEQLLQKSEKDVRFAVSEAYYTCLVLQENALILDSTLSKTNEILRTTNILVNEKVMIATNAKQMELTVLHLKNAIYMVNSQLKSAKTLLKFQMGYAIEKEIVLTDNFATAFNNQPTVTEIDITKNIDYQLVNQKLVLDELNWKNTKANYLPTLAAFLTHQQNALRNDFDFFESGKAWYPTTLWGLQLNIPIFSSGQRAAQVSQMELEMKKTENTLANVSEGLKFQLFQAKEAYELAEQNVMMQQKAIEYAQSVLTDTEILYKEQAVTIMELTQAQSQLLNAQTNYTNALFDLIKAKLQLQKLLN
jgi:outer membrane protein